MIKNKLYEVLHKYIGDYLFGFDKSQLEIAILSGRINMKDVNVKPDKINSQLAALKLPVALKAGMIGKLQLQYNLMSCLSNPFDVTIDDLQVILGPRLPSSDNVNSSFISDNFSDTSYDAGNCFNIHEHQMRFSFKEPEQPPKAESASSPDIMKLVLKNVTLTINRIHIRYEDDFYADQNPFAFGLICERIHSYATGNEWEFGCLENNKFTRALPTCFSRLNNTKNRDPDELIIRETNILGLRIYWKSMAEMYVPISLLESTKRMEKQIFDAISLEDMRNLMRQSFTDETLIDTFSIYSSFTQNTRETAMEEALANRRPRIKAEILFTKMRLNLSPNKLNDVATFLEYAENVKILEELKPYRPLRRPITKFKENETERRKRKRKLIVRDWFFYALWAIRLKKLMKSAPKVKEEREKRLEEFKKLYNKIENGTSKGEDEKMKDLDNYMKKMKQKIDAEIAKKEEEKTKNESKIMGIKLTIRCQEISLKGFSNNPNRIILANSKQPIIEFQIMNPACEIKTGKCQYEVSAYVSEIHLFAYVKNLCDSQDLCDPSFTSPSKPGYNRSVIFPVAVNPPTANAQSKVMTQRMETDRMSLLKSLSRTLKDIERSATVTQRCILSIKPKALSRPPAAIYFKAFLSSKPREKQLISLQFEVGDITIEFFGKLVEELCELLVGYRELYCMRDIRPIKKINDEFKHPQENDADPQIEKEESLKRVMTPRVIKADPSSPQNDSPATLVPNLAMLKRMKMIAPPSPTRTKVAPIFTKIDSYFADHSARVKVGFGEIAVSLFENVVNSGGVMVRSTPFVQLTLPPANLALHKEGEKLNANILGATFVCTKQASFASQFWMDLKRLFMVLSMNEAIRGYIEYYDKLMEDLEKKRTFRFDRAKALKTMNIDTILKIKKQNRSEEDIPEFEEEEETKIAPIKEDRKNPDAFESRRKPEVGKVWQIVRKQESKVKARSILGSERSNGNSYFEPSPKVEYSIVNPTGSTLHK